MDTDLPEQANDIENVIKIISMALFGFFGTASGVWGFLVVRGSVFLQEGQVRYYLFVDLANLTLVNACHLFWAVPAAIWNVNDQQPLINYLVGDVAFCAGILGYNPKLFLGINRFLALAFGGRFFAVFERLKYLQWAIMILCPLIAYALYMMPGCHALFNTDDGMDYFWTEEGCGEILDYYYAGILAYVYLALTTIFDITVFSMMHQRIRAFNKNQSHLSSEQKSKNVRKEYKLGVQMIINLLTGLFLNFSVIGFEYISSTTLLIFITSTTIWQLCSLVSCLSYAILLRDPRKKQTRHNGVMTKTQTRHNSVTITATF